MIRRLLAFTVLVCGLAVLTSCGEPEKEQVQSQTPAAPPVDSSAKPDPVVVDPDHYTAEFENDKVRILRIKYGAGEASVMHYHPESVAVFLTDHQVEMELPDGSKPVDTGGAGEHGFAPAGMHLPKNVGDDAMEVLLVELKTPGSGAAAGDGPDSIVVDAKHYTSEFENDKVRVLRIAYGTGESSIMHYHPDSVAVLLSDHHVSFEVPDGPAEELHANAGEHVFVDGGLHLPSNIGEEPWEVVLVELK